MGGGCHWCTEGVFVSLPGVERVEQGWIAAPAPDAAFSEAVIVHFDPARIAPVDLLSVHLGTHSATGRHALRGRYRSAVYCFDAAQLVRWRELLRLLQADFAEPLVTRVLRFADFRASEAAYRDYFRRDPQRPFCRRYIAPKLDRLRADRPDLFFVGKQ